MSLKSERLKKMESELRDLEQWLKLGLVPKKDIEKHQAEIALLSEKIDEEKDRLQALKENGEVEEFSAPRRQTKTPYQEPQSLPDMEMSSSSTRADSSYDMDTESYDLDTSTDTTENTATGEEDTSPTHTYEEEDDPFSDKNRWKRGVLEDPDADNW